MRLFLKMALAVGVLTTGVVAGVSARGGTSWADEGRARRHAAVTSGVPPSTLRVTRRTALSTARHRFFRITSRSGARTDTTVVLSAGGILDRSTPGAFERVARDEDVVHRVDELGADRVAGWYGALGDAAICEPPVDDWRHHATAAPTPSGGLRLRYAFIRVGAPQDALRACVLEVGPDGALLTAQADGPTDAACRGGADLC